MSLPPLANLVQVGHGLYRVIFFNEIVSLAYKSSPTYQHQHKIVSLSGRKYFKLHDEKVQKWIDFTKVLIYHR